MELCHSSFVCVCVCVCVIVCCCVGVFSCAYCLFMYLNLCTCIYMCVLCVFVCVKESERCVYEGSFQHINTHTIHNHK